MSKEEKRELKHKLESMEDKEDSPEDALVMPIFFMETPQESHDKQPPLEQFEETTAQDFDDEMM